MAGLLEVQHIIVGLYGFQTEYFNQGTGFLAEMQTRLNDFRVVEDHQSPASR